VLNCFRWGMSLQGDGWPCVRALGLNIGECWRLTLKGTDTTEARGAQPAQVALMVATVLASKERAEKYAQRAHMQNRWQ
jgi:hypothetical protein